ncbi:MAG: hypothetical protein Q8O13_04490 [Candidatus Omnitrophota bacterium]|nr:hypothetical protein [Candidatus Omnitrophota bacterium]
MKDGKIKSIVKNSKQQTLNYEQTQFWCPICKDEIIDMKYLDYYGGTCQKCGYDFYTKWIFL